MTIKLFFTIALVIIGLAISIAVAFGIFILIFDKFLDWTKKF